MSWKTNGDLIQIGDIDAKNEISLSKRGVYGEINFSAGKFLHWILISFKRKVANVFWYNTLFSLSGDNWNG